MNNYNVSKTLRFGLKETEHSKFADVDTILKVDKQRHDDYHSIIKPLSDAIHRKFIDDNLPLIQLDLTTCFETYKSQMSNQVSKSVKINQEKLKKEMTVLRKIIAKAFESSVDFSLLFDKKKYFEVVLPKYINEKIEENKDELLATVKLFKGFTMYLDKYMMSRKNFYSNKEQVTAIANRAINENMMTYFNNALNFEKIEISYPELANKIKETGFLFEHKSYNLCLTQAQIDSYNDVVGGINKEKEIEKIGVNQLINEYKQAREKELKSETDSKAKVRIALAKMKPLHKQILGISSRQSFIPSNFVSDAELLESIKKYYHHLNEYSLNGMTKNIVEHLKSLFDALISNEDTEHIYLSKLSLNSISHHLFGDWAMIEIALQAYGEKEKRTDKNKVLTALQVAEWLKSDFYLLDEVERALQIYIASLETDNPIRSKYENKKQLILGYAAAFEYKIKNTAGGTDSISIAKEIADRYAVVEKIGVGSGPLSQDESAKESIKRLLDSIKNLQSNLKPFVLEKEKKKIEKAEKNEFYTEFDTLYDELQSILPLYMKAQSWLTQVPYNLEKVKIHWNSSNFLSGWSQKFENNGAFLYEENGNHFLVIQNKKITKADEKKLNIIGEEPTVRWMQYNFQKLDNKGVPRLFIRTRNENEDSSKPEKISPAVALYNLPWDKIINIYDSGKFKTEHRKVNEAEYKDSLTKIIEYFKLGLSKHVSTKDFTFNFKPSDAYNDIAEFYNDAQKVAYGITFLDKSKDGIMALAKEKKFLIYQLYSKDFSLHSKGKKNLHTLYWQMLFHANNQINPSFKLSGGGEIFYRESNVNTQTISHPKNVKIAKKQYYNKITNITETVAPEVVQELNKHYKGLIALDKLSKAAMQHVDNYSIYKYDITKDKRFGVDHLQAHISIVLNYQENVCNEYMFNENVKNNLATSNNIIKDIPIHIIGIDRGERHLAYYTIIDNEGKIVEQKSLNVINTIDYHQKLDVLENARNEGRKNWQAIDTIKNLKNGYVGLVSKLLADLMIKYNAIVVFEDLNQGFKRGRMKVEKQVYQKLEKALIDKLNYLVIDKNMDNMNEPGGLLNAYQLTPQVSSLTDFGRQCGHLFYVRADYTSKIDPTSGYVNFLNFRYSNMKNAIEYIKLLDGIQWNDVESYFEFTLSYSKFSKEKQVGSIDTWTLCSHGDKRYSYNGKEMKAENVNENLVALFEKYNVAITSENMMTAILKVAEPKFWLGLLFNLKVLTALRYSNKDTKEDYILSPVKNTANTFYDSRTATPSLPQDADANGAYNIARKGLMLLGRLKAGEKDLYIKNEDWFNYIQSK